LLKRSLSLELAILSGLLLLSSFPDFDWGVCGWFCLVPLLLAAVRSSWKWSLVLGGVAGAIFYFGGIHWLYRTLHTFGRLPAWASLSLLLAVVLVLSGFMSVFAACVSWMASLDLRLALAGSPFLWVVLEYTKNYCLTGFPWNLLGYSAWRNLYVLQMASLGGIYLLSFCLAVSSALLAGLILTARNSPRKAVYLLFVVLAFAGSLHVSGYWMISQGTPAREGESFSVGIVQGNFREEVKQKTESYGMMLAEHIRMTESLCRESPRLIVWPESAIPYDPESNLWYRSIVQALAKKCGSYILLGAIHTEEKNLGFANPYYNSAYVIAPDGAVGERYDKMHLVPFSEYNPYKRIFWFIPRVVPTASGFTQGKKIVLHSVGGHFLGILICYEAIFPELARAFSLKGAEFLVNITNDAWFGESSAPYQHFAMAMVRCVENRRPMVRCANTGVSGIIDAYGRILDSTPIFHRTTLSGSIFPEKRLTFYTRHGDYVAHLSLLIFAGLAGYSMARRIHNHRSSDSCKGEEHGN
jgi:apolipoprotein N-acyltransferase